LNALERLGRKRRDRRAQTQPEPPFAVESCECVTEGEFALLRVTGTGLTPPATLVGEGESPESFEPLPQPGASAEDGTWRMAFALPAELGMPGTRLWLHDGGVYLVELVVPDADELTEPEPANEPKPAVEPSVVAEATIAVERAAERRSAAAKQASEDEADDPRARKLVGAWAEAATLREKLAEREEELARALKELLDARHNVEPLREYAEELMIELAGVRKELKQSQKQSRRAAELEAELEAVNAKLESAEPGLAEAVRAKKAAEREAVSARDEVMRLERELTNARLAVENAIRDAQAQLEDSRREAEAAQTRLTAEAEEQQQEADELRTQITKLEEGKSRRRGVGRRSEDRELQKVRAQLEAKIAEREERIQQLEQEAESFAQRREEAMTGSLRKRVDELEEEVRQHTGCNEDLRALLESERELVGAARSEVQDLKRQLATAKAGRIADAASNGIGNGHIAAVPDKPAAKPTVDPPPWSALDDELLARIEKAKTLSS
jgi:chromosome segregation ATPase